MSGTQSPEAGLAPPTRPAHFESPDALRTIWTRPRATVRWVLDHGDGGLWVALLSGALVAWMIHRAVFVLPIPGGRSRAPVLVGSLVLVEAGLAFLLLALLVTGIGRRLGGMSGLRDVARALSWSAAPIAASTPFVVLAALFRGDPAEPRTTFLLLVAYVLWFWSLALAVSALAEAHRFPTQRAGLVLLLGLGTVALVHGLIVLAGTSAM